MLTSGTSNLRLYLVPRPNVLRNYSSRLHNRAVPNVYRSENAGVRVHDNVAPEMGLPEDPPPDHLRDDVRESRRWSHPDTL